MGLFDSIASGLGFLTRKKPSTVPIYPDVSHAFTSIVMVARDVLINPDIAFRTDRDLSDQMIRDPMVMAPLEKRALATAQLDWQIIPQDDNDKRQVEIAQAVEKTIRAMPRKVDFFKSLLWATFRGTGASELFWDQSRRDRSWGIKKHKPHHGDKFVYDIHGNPRILVRSNQSAGRALSGEEQDRLIIHTHSPEDGTFFEGAEAGYVFKGRGLRDVIWQYWWLKHNALKFWVRFLERYGGGMAIGRYPASNPQAKAAIESVLQNLINDSMVSMPVEASDTKENYGVEIQTVSGAAASTRLFKEFVEDWAGHHIRLAIEGQELTSTASPTGLGSGLAEVHQNTFRMLRDYDAAILGDTITQQLVKRIIIYNFGDVDFDVRFEFITDTDNWDQEEKRVKAAMDMGLEVPKEWPYETLGIPQPQEDDEVITLGAGGGFGSIGALGSDSIFDAVQPIKRGGGVFDPPTNGDGADSIFASAVRGKRYAEQPAFDENKHPRADDGKFGPGGGGDSKNPKGVGVEEGDESEIPAASIDDKVMVNGKPGWAVSKDEFNGEGAVLHTSPADFSVFDDSKKGSTTDEGLLGEGFYFSTDPNIKQDGESLMSVRLDMDNPLKISLPSFADGKSETINEAIGTTGLSGVELTEKLKSLGHDGVVMDYSPTGYNHQETVVFEANQTSTHRGIVEMAIEQGMGVPQEALADYPDLQARSGKETSSRSRDSAGRFTTKV